MSAECMTVHCHNQHNYIISKTYVKNPRSRRQGQSWGSHSSAAEDWKSFGMLHSADW